MVKLKFRFVPQKCFDISLGMGVEHAVANQINVPNNNSSHRIGDGDNDNNNDAHTISVLLD